MNQHPEENIIAYRFLFGNSLLKSPKTTLVELKRELNESVTVETHEKY